MASARLAATSAKLLLLTLPGLVNAYSFAVSSRSSSADVQPHDASLPPAPAKLLQTVDEAAEGVAAANRAANAAHAATTANKEATTAKAAKEEAATAAKITKTVRTASALKAAAEPRLMRKEAAHSQKQMQLEEPAGYYNRGEDCPGSHMTSGRFQPLFLRDAVVSDCSKKCSSFDGCVGFTFNPHQSTCYFKATGCWNTTNNGWTFYQKETCDYSQAACEAAIANNDKYSKAENFVQNSGEATGCLTRTYGRDKNVVFYVQLNGKDVRIKEELTPNLPSTLARVAGYGCIVDGTLIQEPLPQKVHDAVGSASLLEQEADWEPLLVLEDELERVAELSEETLMAEAAAHGLPWPPQRSAPRKSLPATIELGGFAPPILLQESDRNEADDEEDKRNFGNHRSVTAP
mmetsp:Transcript_84358/g.176567  ORF Transcript_84358/g.176567 Transcript_84358/m.176567 type:complete len:405 (-) Transcript_84358:7-1221(-)